jgi:hypothetical protein
MTAWQFQENLHIVGKACCAQTFTFWHKLRPRRQSDREYSPREDKQSKERRQFDLFEDIML